MIGLSAENERKRFGQIVSDKKMHYDWREQTRDRTVIFK